MIDSQQSDNLTRTLQAVALLAGLCLTLTFVWVATERLLFPHEVKWMEGGMLDQVIQVLDGRHLYTEPSWEFGTYLYTPLFYYLSAVVSFVTGINFMSMRVVSLLSTAAIAVLIALIVRRESDSTLAAALGAMLYLASYEATGFFMDAGRSDSLFLALVFGYIYCARYGETAAAQVLAGALGALALLTKQTAVIACAPIAIYLFFSRTDRLRFVAPVTGIVLASAALAALELSSNGWFSYYTLELPGAHRYQWHKFPSLTFNEFVLQHGLSVAVGVMAVIAGRSSGRRPSNFVLVVFATQVVASLLPYMHTGSSLNVLLPMQAGTAVLAGTSLGLLVTRPTLQRAALLLLVLQFGVFTYNPYRALPIADQAMRAEQIVACMAALPKPVLNTRTGFLWTQTDKPRSIHEPSAADIFRTGPSPQNAVMRDKFIERIENQYYSAIFFGPQLQSELGELLEGHYVQVGYNLPMLGPDGDTSGYMVGYAWISQEYAAGRDQQAEAFCTEEGFLPPPDSTDADTSAAR